MTARLASVCTSPGGTLPGVGDLRHDKRRPFRARVQCWIQYGESSSYWQSAFWGVTEDICHEGIFVAADRVPAIDSLVLLGVHTEYGLLKLMARVVHCIQDIGFGCQFIHLTEQQRVALVFLQTMTRRPRPAPRVEELAA